MFEVLVFMFENYFTHHETLDDAVMEQELSAAGFEQDDILGAFDWFQQMQSMFSAPLFDYSHEKTAIRIFHLMNAKGLIPKV